MRLLRTGGVLAATLFTVACAEAQFNAQVAFGPYDVLGLKLGMSGKEAAEVLTNRFHVTMKDVSYVPVNGRYVPGRKFIPNISLYNGQIHLVVHFIEVAPGAGEGSEILSDVQYEPQFQSDAERQQFITDAFAKYGKPTVFYNRYEAYWSNRNYGSSQEFLESKAAVLHIQVKPTVVVLENRYIRSHMEEIYNSKQRGPVAPI